MTSEVVVMNNLAVALAADSAATVSDGRENKVYKSANKLFMLSKHHPIGIMVYDNSSLLGIPWETILKMFRHELRTTEFDRLEEYGSKLIEFLDRNQFLFPEKVQIKFYLSQIETLYRRIAKAIAEEYEQKLVEKMVAVENVEDPDTAGIASRIIAQTLREWQSKKNATCFPDVSIGPALAGKLSGEIQSLIVKVFAELPPPGADDTNALRELATLLITKDEIPIESRSGLVIAGFGRKDYFPVMQTFELGEVFSDRLKYREQPLERIDTENTSVVKAFAHDDMVDTFLRGVSSEFEYDMVRAFVTLVVGFPNEIIDAITDLDDEQKTKWKQQVLSKSAEPIRAFVTKIESDLVEAHRRPILNAIINLPLDELAHVAKSLVNLNSFEKQVSMDTETVGGPVDVAVISKGDGFIWIERKHYFRPELNRHFFRNYNERQLQADDPTQAGDETGGHDDGE